MRRDAVRLVESAVEFYVGAILLLSVPSRADLRVPETRYAASVGLFGASVEQMMSGCLIQVAGPEIILHSGSGRFKTGAEILSDFKKQLGNPVPRLSFITADVEDPGEHRRALSKLASGFRALIVLRAGGLHAGVGPEPDALWHVANNLHSFFSLLAKSSRVRPYLRNLPSPPRPPQVLDVFIHEMTGKANGQSPTADQTNDLTSIFLVLPEGPDEEPEWLQLLERVATTPTDGDVRLLLTAVETAVPARLRRVGARGEDDVVPVRIAPNDPRAIPIATQELRRSFQKLNERWAAAIGSANGSLDFGVLDMPPIELILEIFAVGLVVAGILDEEGSLTGHDAWPWVAASLARQGTEGPYWFIVRRCHDLGQLAARLRRAGEVGGGTLRRRLNNDSGVLAAIDALRSQRALSSSHPLAREIGTQHLAAERAREMLPSALKRHEGKERGLSGTAASLVASAACGDIHVGEAIARLIEDGFGLSLAGKKYWARELSKSAYEPDDAPALVKLCGLEIHDPDTEARKAIRLIDQLSFGPLIE